MTVAETSSLAGLRRGLQPLAGTQSDFDGLLEWIGDARFVLIGEASHGTHEFYEQRAAITRRLITEKGFGAVAAEADWPDAYRASAYVRGSGTARTAEEALRGFERFPTWMWRNTVVVSFLDWLRSYNAESGQGVGFYGMDLYSLYTSIHAVLEFLERVDPEAAERARYRYSCFEHFHEDSQAYGYAANFDLTQSCEEGAVRQLLDLQQSATERAKADGRVDPDEEFYVLQNARLVKNAEEYYRTMFQRGVSSWNLRDRHMADTVDQLAEYLQDTKVVVWAHNSHLGDARATEMGRRGELNVGQLMRERHGREAFNIGFTTHRGEVSAASDWGEPLERKRVRAGRRGSYEQLFHSLEVPRFIMDLQDAPGTLPEQHLERAIGVIYRPESELLSHYFEADLRSQFDAVIHLDTTHALQPLERTPHWDRGEPPETYPSAL